MRQQARVVVIGGGAMGVSLLYHLAKRGWSDVMLVERQELTAGSTWHAAGLCTHFAHNATIMEMRAHSVRLYREILTAETGLPTGFHPSGALRITRSPERMDEFRHVQGLGRFVGHDFHILSPDELKQIYPLCHTDGIIGAIYEPNDGHVDPTLATNAMASGARSRGAEIVRHNPVLAIERKPSGEWLVRTQQGDIVAEHVVNAAGTWCREIGAMMGLDLPVVPMLHQYVVTDTVPEIADRIAAGAKELPIIRDPEESWYLRQERDGFIVGPYEKSAHPWAVDGVPPEFGMDLLPPDLDRVEHIIALAMERVPALANAGIKTVVNGPITFTPDANPLVGPAFGLGNAWLLTGSSMGVMEGGGAGRFLADWIVDGSPPMDALAIDPRRFGNYADRDYRIDKAVEGFGLQFGIHYPNEEREAGRPRRTTPALELQRSQGAVLGAAYGWERPNWFAAKGADRDPPLTFRKPGWFDAVRGECRDVQASVGAIDLSAFSKFEIGGPGASAFMASLGANRPPERHGRIGLIHALTAKGGVASEFTVTRLGDEGFYLTSAALAERHDEGLLRSRAAAFPGVTIDNVTERRGVLGVMGPRARDLLGKICEADLSNAAFPWLSAQIIRVAGIKTAALRVSYAGELGWELHVQLAQFGKLYEAITKVGTQFDLRPFGIYALNAMRLEKGYRAWGADLTTERTPLEAGLGALVKTDNRTFVGREAMLERIGESAWSMLLLEIDDDGERLPFYAHAVMQAGRPVGVVTSGSHGFRTGKTVALAYLRPGVAAEGLTVSILGRELTARELKKAPYDPDNLRLRGLQADAPAAFMPA
ncbi:MULTISPECIES: FAD-dependent oxidoreductase [unclassified Mesorhizobium]|uniref:GcvT family protein n=1 Tax=unclassified Mesorhizobium TaxID=325217 RepID=UPI0011281350|nr:MULTISPECIES: FAD-dependent oxidoreductase [unclassified Mesorhizobium]TPK50708.1 FAD-dependent oxidoreductase [Mesorhizobium sp. B2-5-2]TPL23675.1 FAD-dependent oxidoreductase [Mesorhizobium sp. B2-4-7]TPL26112.1 FAD-dependent oxidoreductase [Mesorhizobium sp. B2-4-9]TPL38746.1 FAD-dependent oxidoreductase [Mesorhizobium sp. B2-4-5]TPM73897.1 FAD-dependent oxidoreductase [Mesorhizobium sp. B2-1-6]